MQPASSAIEMMLRLPQTLRMTWQARLLFLILSLGLLPPLQASCDELKIISRKEWKARPAKQTEVIEARVEEAMVPRGSARYLTVHHTGVPASRAPLAQKMQKHQALMFDYSISSEEHGRTTTKHIFLRDSPYHFFIDAAGHVAEGRELHFAAFSNTTYLTPIKQHITIAVEGDFNREEPSDAQMRSLIELLADVAKRYSIKLADINYHQNVVAKRVQADGSVQYGTDCPGKNLIARFAEIRSELHEKGTK